MPQRSVDGERATNVAIRPLDDSNRAAVVAFMGRVLDRPQSQEFEDWRYRQCPTMEAATAMAGNDCVATMFALQRTYHTPDGDTECLEPFEWHANEEWRAQAPGLRLVKHYMKGSKPLVAVTGTKMARGLLERLKWQRIATAERFALPLTGRYWAQRGYGTVVTRLFDLAGRSLFAPRRPRTSALILEPAGAFAPPVAALAARQRRFALMRLPDASTVQWLRRAPATVGHYVTLHARLENELIGWVSARIFRHSEQRAGELLEVFLADDMRSWYPTLVAKASATLAGFGADVLLATTTCPDTVAALKRLRFRPAGQSAVLVWWGGAPAPKGPVLIDGAFSDHSFFPLPTASAAAWLEGPARDPR